MITGKCLNCNAPLKHLIYPIETRCIECGEVNSTYIICKDGHYYCNHCAAKKSIKNLYESITLIDDKNPIDVAEKLLMDCGVCGNSPHAIVTASFLMAYRNVTSRIDSNTIIEGIDRAAKIPGGWCGYYGACGAGIGLGVAFSVLLEATPLSDEERSISNIATAEALKCVADQGGPRCCTASVRRVIEKSIELAEIYLKVSFPKRKKMFGNCWQSQFNEDCRNEKCKYFERKER